MLGLGQSEFTQIKVYVHAIFSGLGIALGLGLGNRVTVRLKVRFRVRY